MRVVEINLAVGGDVTVDPRVAPQGTLVRAQNVRLDRQGRLVARNGYTSLGTSVLSQVGPLTLRPMDLHDMDGQLIAIGSHDPAQIGIHHPYKYVNTAQGAWRVETGSTVPSSAKGAYTLPAADNAEILYNEVNAQPTDIVVADASVSIDGKFAALASIDLGGSGQFTRLTVIDLATEQVVFTATTNFGGSSEGNPRLLALTASTFVLFTQIIGSTFIRAATLDMSSATPSLPASTVISAAATAYPAPYDVSLFVGSTDYLIAYATATGYTWRRFNSAHVQQTTTSVVDLADAPVSICGALGETVSVLNVKATANANLRTFTTAGALSVGPTVFTCTVALAKWVSVVRRSSTEVFCRGQDDVQPNEGIGAGAFNTTTHAAGTGTVHFSTRAWTSALFIDDVAYAIETLAMRSPPSPYGIVGYDAGAANSADQLHGCMLDGVAKVAYSATTAWYQSTLSTRAGTREVYGAVVRQDPRDKTYRACLVRFEVGSAKRRQGVTMSKVLYLAGANVMQYDGRVTAEVGFEISPALTNVAQGVGGALTLLGVYTMHAIFRCVSANGETTQSAPSSPATVTLTGVNNRISAVVLFPYGLRMRNMDLDGATAYLDIYRTEAGGSIPRFSQSLTLSINSLNAFGLSFNFGEGNADSVVQAGAPMYTQGADGAISGRLPLGRPNSARFMAETGGKLLLGGLEKDTELQLSVERRPGESQGFVNDDLFFVNNPESITGLAVSRDGRRYIFGRSTVRELLGDGPNAAGADATLLEPSIVEPSIGCVDWRSIASTELGVFFQSSGAPDPKIYLLPDGGSSAILVSESIRDTLRAFPTITSVVRHEQEQLLSFTLQNAAGNDGRIVHLDLTTSGMGKFGWIGKWFIDRVPQLEGSPGIEIVEEAIYPFQFMFANATISVPLPNGKRIGDRLHLIVATSMAGSAVVATPSGFSQIVTGLGSTFERVTVFEQLVNNSAQQLATAITLTPSTVSTVAAIVKVVLLRGCHATQPSEGTSAGVAAGNTIALPTLTPSWGLSTKNHWQTAVNVFAPFVPTAKRWPNTPSGFGRIVELGVSGSNQQSAAFGSQSLDAASLAGVSWGAAVSSILAGVLVATRPLASSGTPVRAATRYQGRHVVCNDTDVILSDPNALQDFGAAFVVPELEFADLYPMGAGGAGRHQALVFVGELLGFCQLNMALSYDEGRNWTASKSFLLHPSEGYSIGQTVRLEWVPKRRKVTGVRARISVSPNTNDVPLAGNTRGVAFQRLLFHFDELIGPVRLETLKKQ